MSDNMIRGSVYKDKNGVLLQVVDQEARERIGELSEEIAELKGNGGWEETITPEIVGYLLMTGKFNANDSTRRTDYISLDGVSNIKAQYRLIATGCAVAFFDANKTFMPDASIAGTGTTEDTITEMTPPTGAAYVMFSHFLGSDGNYVGFITLSGGGGGAEKTVNVEPQTGYVKYDTGLIASDTGGWNTGYVETAGFEKAEYYGRMNSGGAVLAFYDANKLYLQSDSVAGSPSGIEWVSGTVEIPSDAAYAMVSSYGTGSGNNSGGAAYLRLFSEGGGGIAGLEADIADLTVKVNPLKGKRFAVLGDSISSVNYTLPVWWQLIAEKYGCEFVNYGVSASRIAVSDATVLSFTERYATMDDTVDGVVVVGGTNDSWYTPIGEFNSADNTTLNGALNEMLPGLLNKYPGKPVLFFAPIQREDYTDSDYPVTVADLKVLDVTTVIGRDRVNLAIMVKCRQYGVPCVDLYTACGINGNDENSAYFRTDDNLHPSALGMQRIAGVVAAEMVKHFMFAD